MCLKVQMQWLISHCGPIATLPWQAHPRHEEHNLYQVHNQKPQLLLLKSPNADESLPNLEVSCLQQKISKLGVLLQSSYTLVLF